MLTFSLLLFIQLPEPLSRLAGKLIQGRFKNHLSNIPTAEAYQLLNKTPGVSQMKMQKISPFHTFASSAKKTVPLKPWKVTARFYLRTRRTTLRATVRCIMDGWVLEPTLRMRLTLRNLLEGEQFTLLLSCIMFGSLTPSADFVFVDMIRWLASLLSICEVLRFDCVSGIGLQGLLRDLQYFDYLFNNSNNS